MLDLLAYLLAVLWLAERVGKWIPDDATGVLGWIRKAGKTISMYTENK